MKTTNQLTLAGLEALARAYMSCELTRLEEAELAVVLSRSELDSPALREAREAMGIEMMLAEGAAKREGGMFRQECRRRRTVWRRVGIAAAVALIAGVGLTPLLSGREAQVEMIVDGRRLSGETARTRAAQMQAEDMAMMRDLMADAARAQAENIQLIQESL